MIKGVKILLFFGLIEALVSFAPASVLLSLQALQEVSVRNAQFYAVTATASAAALCSLLLILGLGIDFYGKRVSDRFNARVRTALVLIGLLSCSIAVYAFIAGPSTIPENFFIELDRTDTDFFHRFVFSARLEFSWIGLSAFLIWAVKVYERSQPPQNA